MADKYLKQDSGKIVEHEVIITSAGAGDSGKLVGLDSTGKLDETFMPVGIGAQVKIFPCSENLTAGNWINVWDDTGTLRVRKADATTAGKEAHGFVLDAYTSGDSATCYFDGINDQLGGLSGALECYLSITAGATATTPPFAAGNIVQRVGVRLSAGEVAFQPGPTIGIA